MTFRRRVYFSLPFLTLILIVMGIAQVPAKREFRGAWIATVANLDWPSPSARGNVAAQKAELTAILDRLKAAGISAVIFQVRPECDALYGSPYEPWSYFLTGSQGTPPYPLYDPLEFAVREVHKRGMEIHAWFNPYRAVRVAGSYPVSRAHVSVRHPEWILTFTRVGQKLLDPGHPGVRTYIASIVADVVRRYDIDGVHCDDYFYPYPVNSAGFPGVTTEDVATFNRYSRRFTDIQDWRRDNVNLLITMIGDSIRALKPHVKFGMSPFGIWKRGVPTGISGMGAYNAIYCDALSWLRRGVIDYVTPLLYWQIGGGQDYAALMRWWADSTSYYGRHMYPGMATYRTSAQHWRPTELTNQVRLNRLNPKVKGQIYFRATYGINDNPRGFADSLMRSVYAYPALLPVMTWKDSIPPNPPRRIRSIPLPGTGQLSIQWDPPQAGKCRDTLFRYAVYRFDHYPWKWELTNPRNLVAVEGVCSLVPTPLYRRPSYYVVTSLDRNWNESDTSNVLLITVPSRPSLASPADGAIRVPDSVRMTWRAVPLAASYRLQVSTDPSFVSGILFDQPSIPDTFKVLANLTARQRRNDARYFWRVSAENPVGSSGWSAPFGFRTAVMRASRDEPAGRTSTTTSALTKGMMLLK